MIDLTVHADPTLAIDAVDIAIRAAGKADKHLSRSPGKQILVNIFIDGLASGAVVNLEVAGLSNGTTVVLAHAKAAVVEGKHVPVEVNLTNACLGVLTCTAEETCDHGLCVPLPSLADGGAPDGTADTLVGTGGQGGLGNGTGGSANVGGRGGLVGSGGAVAGSGGGVAGSGGAVAGSGGAVTGNGGGTAGGNGGGVGSGGGGGVGGNGGRMTPGTGGGAGGSKGSGGSGTGGMMGCQTGATQCSTGGLQTCSSNGQWGMAMPCGSRRTCTGPVGTAKCVCNADPVCGSVGNTCASSSKLASCSQDGDGCFYQASSSMCTNGTCTGAPGTALCCTNICTSGATQCGGGGVQTCQAGTNGCTIWKTSSCGAPLVCERYGGPTCANPDWAEWPVPNSPAETDAPNIESYTDNGDGTITDNVTRLMWQTAVATMKYSQPAAVAYCPTQTTGGHTDWRLPSVIELFSLVDHGVYFPSINTTYFPGTPQSDSIFWSSTVTAGAPSRVWSVIFDFGDMYDKYDMTDKRYVRCVR